MKHILLILFLLLPVMTFGQSKEADSLYNEGMKLYNAQQAHLAVPILQKADSLEKAQLDPKSPNYYRSEIGLAKCWKDLANYYAGINDTTEALRLQNLVVEICKKMYGEKHSLYAESLTNLADIYAKTNNYTEAIRLATNGLEIMQKDTIRGFTRMLLSTYRRLDLWNSDIGNYNEAIRLLNISLEYTKKNEWASPYISPILLSLAYNYRAIGQYDKAKEMTIRGYSLMYSQYAPFLSSTMAFRTNKERTSYWKQWFSEFYSEELTESAYRYPDSSLNSIVFNSLVLSKGFLLNSELEIERIIRQKGDSVLIARYNKFKQDLVLLDVLNNIPLEKRTMDADSLVKAIDDEEHQLVEMSNELGNYVQNLAIDWKEIQKNLREGDLAIEFANFKDTTEKQIYVALVLKKGMNSPEIVKLFSETELNQISSVGYYKSPKLYNLVWKPLEKYLTGVKNVYFSPCGMFHTVGIEYLPDENRKIFAEKFGAYRLSSTRELALERKQNPNKKAATYGGIKYDSDKGGGNVRGVATYLKGTKIESETVAKLLQSADFSVIALSDTSATEESFKNLSGSGLKILHIGTHGFYYAAENLENAGFSFFSDKQQSEEDKALSCSGLLFAGANFALDTENRSALPEGDDGILTAKEISRLDFKGLDLVVLSACQTGLGEVTGEGVFGLQRGFKKAGAQTIIMSLWEVDDYATRLLMTEFFKGLTAGKTKREAFLSALNYVKAKNSDPKYWAAFVMVDGE